MFIGRTADGTGQVDEAGSEASDESVRKKRALGAAAVWAMQWCRLDALKHQAASDGREEKAAVGGAVEIGAFGPDAETPAGGGQV